MVEGICKTSIIKVRVEADFNYRGIKTAIIYNLSSKACIVLLGDDRQTRLNLQVFMIGTGGYN